ncbi:hypothetical protein [Mangrovicoccus sp. HB161399]|uniref:hypothetical protein n=1 Tax=Mangrovicoccus sp. HB161399 TaxID=2720392 RepID=UPI0015556231|nr:hypothetical protein [Mangrovicoccus sp. HB161399]
MFSEPRISVLRSVALALACLAGHGAAFAGDLAVAPMGPVYGPVFVPTPLPQAAPAAAAAASGTIGYQVAEELRYAAKFCGQLGDRYQVDCVSERIAAAAAKLPKTGDYAESWAALDSASKQLEALAQDAWDRDTPRITARAAGTTPVRTSRPLRAVEADRMPAVRQQAARVLEETQTVLLRSASRSAERQGQFLEIAQALDSNKVLLRS